jgi:hypothetical protein
MKKLLVGLMVLGSISSAMACPDLDKNVRADTTTWTTLYQLGQLNSNFMDSGKVSINSLPVISIGVGNGEEILADQIHQMITVGLGAKSITGKNEALEALVESMKNDESVCEFAKRLDDKYTFWHE